MYKTLYRKFRPKLFLDVVGQEHVTITLKNELKFGKVSHAYLFIGSHGTGKTTCAKIFAKAVNCLNLKDGDACCECEVCKSIEKEAIDVTELDAASNNSVNDVRALCENSNFLPSFTKYRVYIVDEVHMLSSGAFAALLKTLEEPPSHVIFILATTEVQKLPATILSRCQCFEFYKIKPEIISKKLEHISSIEGIKLTKQASLLIANYANGALRDALSLLEKFVGTNEIITEEVAFQTLGLVSEDYLYDLAFNIAKKNSQEILTIISKLCDASKDVKVMCEGLIKIFRDIMVLKVSKDFKNLIVLNRRKEDVLNIMSFFTIKEIIRILNVLQNCLQDVVFRGTSRIDFEVSLISLCNDDFLSMKVDVNKSNKYKLESNLALNEKKSSSKESKNDFKEEVLNFKKGLEKKVLKTSDSIDLKSKKDSIKNKSDDFSFENFKALDKINNEENCLEEKMKEKEKLVKNNKDVLSSKIDFEKSKKETIFNLDDMEPLSLWKEVLKKLAFSSKLIYKAFINSEAYVKNKSVFIDAPKQLAYDLLKSNLQKNKIYNAILEVTGVEYELFPYNNRNNSKNDLFIQSFIKHAENCGFEVLEKY
ncbi:MAG: DNA polymerase III subunit gamma/tau [Oscillospiraceae bacterium]|nr:DNA polymerase III subunit gamma/tau [Oscillospiraceae bacterium]